MVETPKTRTRNRRMFVREPPVILNSSQPIRSLVHFVPICINTYDRSSLHLAKHAASSSEQSAQFHGCGLLRIFM